MKLLSKKYIIFVAILGLIPFILPTHVLAVIPDVSIRVLNGSTNLPIPGVWVRQKNNGNGSNPSWSSFLNQCNGSNSTQAISGRYSQTNGSGIALFVDPELINQSACNQSIDSNKDGTNDVVSFPCTTGISRVDDTSSCQAFGEFSCYGNPMLFEVVKPAGDNGTYSTVSNITIPNAAADMQLTVYYTPAGQTVAPTPTPNPITDSSKKEIGSIANIGAKFIPQTQLEVGKDYWVRIQIFNSNKGSTLIKLHEVLNSPYFQLYQPYYDSTNYINGTFFINSPVYSGYSYKMEDTTNTECAQVGSGLPACISKYSAGGNAVSVQPTEGFDGVNYTQKYFFFKVKAVVSSNGSTVKVDVDDTYPAHEGSYIDYLNSVPKNESSEPGLDNEDVVICPIGGCSASVLSSYFQVSKGDTYSSNIGDESIKSILPTGVSFSPDSSSIVIHNGVSTKFGAGSVSPTNWYTKGYQIDSIQMYNKLYNEYSGKLITKNIQGVDSFTTSGYYIDTSTQASAINRYTISGSKWRTELVGKQIVYFVPSDLYIDEDLSVAATNGSSIIYVVSGNVGISPSVAKVEGIILADGVIDTACDSKLRFSGTTCSNGSQSLTTPLTLEGIYYSKGGFNLDRSTSTGAAEYFVGRPDFLLSTISTLGKNVYSWKEYAN